MSHFIVRFINKNIFVVLQFQNHIFILINIINSLMLSRVQCKEFLLIMYTNLFLLLRGAPYLTRLLTHTTRGIHMTDNFSHISMGKATWVEINLVASIKIFLLLLSDT